MMKLFRSFTFAVLLSPLCTLAQTGTWGVTHLPEAAHSLVAASSLSKVFFLQNNSRKLFIYDEPTGSWTTDSIPTALKPYNIAAIGSKVFICCDSTANYTVSKTLHVYDQLSGTWSVQQLSQPRGGVRTCSWGSKLFFVGGYSFGGGPMGGMYYYGQTRIDVYDTITSAWSSLHLPQTRFWYGPFQSNPVYAQNDRIFVTGGQGVQYNMDFRETEIYDLSSNTWSAKNVLTPAGSFNGIGDVLFYWYGSPPVNPVPTATFEKYSFSSNQWNTGAFQYPRYAYASNAGSDRVFFGGSDKYLDVYYAPADSFYVDSLLLDRSAICFASANRTLMFAGGSLPGNIPTDHVDIFVDTAATISLRKTSEEVNLRLFPNPADDRFIADLGKYLVSVKAQLLDVEGREIKTLELKNVSGFDMYTADISNGVYSLQIQTQGQLIRKKIVITH